MIYGRGLRRGLSTMAEGKKRAQRNIFTGLQRLRLWEQSFLHLLFFMISLRRLKWECSHGAINSDNQNDGELVRYNGSTKTNWYFFLMGQDRIEQGGQDHLLSSAESKEEGGDVRRRCLF